MIDQIKETPELTTSKELNAKIYPKEYYDQLLKPGAIFTIKGTESFLKDFQNLDNKLTIDSYKVWKELDLFKEYIGNTHGKSSYIDKSIYIGKDIELFKIKEIFICGEHKFVITTELGNCLLLDMKKILEAKTEMFTKVSVGYQQILESNLSNGLKIQDKGKNVIITNGSKEVNIPGMNYSVLDAKKNRVVTYDDKGINILDIKDDLSYIQLQIEDISMFGVLKYATMDINKNFVVCIFEKDNQENPDKKISELKILQFDHGVDLTDSHSPSCLIEQETIPDIQNILYIDDNNDIIALDTDYQVRRIQTNMQEFPVGYKGRAKFSKEDVKVRKAVNKTLEDATVLLTKGIKIDTEEMATEEEDIDIAKLRRQIRDMPFEDFDNKTLKQLFDTSETVEDLMKVKSIVDAIKRTPEIAAVHGLLDPIESTVFKKYNQAKLDELYVRLDTLANSLGAGEDFNNLIYVQSSLKEIQKDRLQIANIAPTAKDKGIKELTQIVNDKIKDYRESHQDDIQEKIDINLETIKEYLENIDYLNQITSVYNTDVRKNTETMLGYMDEEGKKKNKDAMKNLVKEKQNKLSKGIIDIQKKNQAEEQVKIDEIKDQIGQIKQIISVIYEEDALKDMEKNDPLVLNIRSTIENISSNKAQELIVQLEQAFKERILSVKYSKDTTKKGVKSLDAYGIPTSLYFVPDINKKVKWELMGKHVGDKIKIYFETNTGVKIEPDINKRILGNFPFQVTHEEFIEIKKNIAERRSNGKKKEFKELIHQANEIKKEVGEGYKENEQYKELNDQIEVIDKKYYIPRMLEVMNTISGGLWNMSNRPLVPSIHPHTVIGPSVKKFFDTIGKSLSQRDKYKDGMIIVQSEAGTGKNFKMDVFANLTNRELVHISCNQSMEKEDLLFSPEISSEGTFRKKSELIKGLQTPGSIILLDEINTLKGGVSKLLNPLLTGQRYINDPQMGRIYAHPSVLIVGLMNPSTYIGTTKLAQEVSDRALRIDDDYPEAMEEGYIISKYLDAPMGNMTSEEFDTFWHKYIDQGEVPNDKRIYNIFMDIHKVMTLARKVRELYSKTMKGEADMDKELDFVFSIRGSSFIIQDYNDRKNIKQSMETVLLPKIENNSHKKIMQSLINEVCK